MPKKLVKGATKKIVKEALNISTRAVGGAAADIAKESIKEELEERGVKDVVKNKIHKTTKKFTER